MEQAKLFQWGDDPTTAPTSATQATQKPTSKPTEAPTSAPVTENVVYFDGSAIATGTERWVVYTWSTDTDGQFITMTQSGSLFQASIPKNNPNIIICRMNGGVSTNSWDSCWNHTYDLKYSDGNLVKTTGWASAVFNVTQSNK